MILTREYILSGADTKQLFYATNNKAPHQPITLNLIHLITHDYNPHNIPKFFPNTCTFFSLIPLISISLSLSSKPSVDLPSPTPPPIYHHPTMMLLQLSPENGEARRWSARA